MPSEGQKPTKCAGASVRVRRNMHVSLARVRAHVLAVSVCGYLA